MDFCRIEEKSVVQGRGRDKSEIAKEIVPRFVVEQKVKDLMIRGKSFYAVYDEKTGMWSTNEFDVQRIVDEALFDYANALKAFTTDDVPIKIMTMQDFSSNSWLNYRKYVQSMADNAHDLDCRLIFADTKVSRDDYASHRLGYSLNAGDCSAWDKLVGTLYATEERRKLEWAIGAIVSGDSTTIQKFVVLYGEGGTGKSTILEIINRLFDGYCVNFTARSLGTGSDQFATEMFKTNPLVAYDAEADLSHIEDNTVLNAVVSHDVITVNEKHKSRYSIRPRCFLFLASNSPVRITDARSGIIRRLIDVHPTGNLLDINEYEALMSQIDFQLGAIAQRCLNVYRALGKNYYKNYVPRDMIAKTNVFFNFIEEVSDELRKDDGISLSRAYAMYKEYCDDALVEYRMPKYKFREELKVYFRTYEDRTRVNGAQVRCWYSGFRTEKVDPPVLKKNEPPLPLVLDETESLLDDILADCPAQYGNDEEAPEWRWANVETRLRDLDTKRLHYILPKLPEGHPPMIMVDFDLRNADGEKDIRMNLEAASRFPPTYAEFSKGGCGVHLHYFYDGDAGRLRSVFSPGIEVKVFRGNAAIRRRLSKCNNVPVATISGGLPLKEEKMLDVTTLKDEMHLRNIIKKCLRKENHGATRPEIDLIYKVLEDAYSSGMKYDVSDMEHDILVFAMNSTHQSDYCVKRLRGMRFRSKETDDVPSKGESAHDRQDEVRRINGMSEPSVPKDALVFFDCEVFPNLFLINWKAQGEGAPVVRMINPTPNEVEALFKFRLVGFNCRKYDNHMLYGRYLGLSEEQLYELSQRIIVEQGKEAFYPEAYDISYTDVFDYCKTKQSLKKWEIQLHIHHQELGLPWDQPVPEELWTKVAEYCDNDVLATEAVFNATAADFIAREILADVAGLTVNDTTNSLTTRIIFGMDRNPQSQFNYRFMGDLSDVSDIYDDRIRALGLDPEYTRFDSKGRPLFPGYTFELGKSVYRGEEVGEGGYVYAEPGIYYDVPVIDIASMHPSSVVDEELFGPVYTQRFKDILDARIAIKHKDYERAKTLLGGKLAKYLDDKSKAKALAGALKIAINSVYGLTSARFINPFRDRRNIDNIVAKRGALFMVNLKHEVQRRGFRVVHIKTDSIKIANATPEIISFVTEYGRLYGYNFEHESTYDRICLVNDAVYIARYAEKEQCEHLYGYIPEKNGDGEQYVNDVRVMDGWTATGAQFAQPYVFKTLFSGDPLTFDDYCEMKSVTGAIYLDMNERLPDVTAMEEEMDRRQYNALHGDKKPKKLSKDFAGYSDEALSEAIAKGHSYQFVGRTGLFFPIMPGRDGGIMYRQANGKYFSVTGTKGYRWLEAEMVQALHREDDLDPRYHRHLADDAIEQINRFGDFDDFVSGRRFSVVPQDPETEPVVPCGDGKFNTCFDCPNCVNDVCRRGYSLASYVEGGDCT